MRFVRHIEREGIVFVSLDKSSCESTEQIVQRILFALTRAQIEHLLMKRLVGRKPYAETSAIAPILPRPTPITPANT